MSNEHMKRCSASLIMGGFGSRGHCWQECKMAQTLRRQVGGDPAWQHRDILSNLSWKNLRKPQTQASVSELPSLFSSEPEHKTQEEFSDLPLKQVKRKDSRVRGVLPVPGGKGFAYLWRHRDTDRNLNTQLTTFTSHLFSYHMSPQLSILY